MRDVVFWLLMAYYLLAVLVTVAVVGKPRPPISPMAAAVTLCFALLNVWGIAYLWGTP